MAGHDQGVVPEVDVQELLVAQRTLAVLGAQHGLVEPEVGDAEQLLGHAQRLGVLVNLGEQMYEVPSPSVLALVEQAVASGISLAGAVDVFERTQEHIDAVAAAFVRLFVADVWREFEHAGMPIERWPGVNEAIDRLRRLATAAVSAAFEGRLSARIDDAFELDPERA